MTDWIRKVQKYLADGRAFVLVTILDSTGSVPRGAGSRMLVTEEGQWGTIGGGAVEYAARKEAENLLSQKISLLRQYCLDRNAAAEIGMVCGGDITVFFQYTEAGSARMHRFCERAEQILGSERKSWLVLDVTDPQQWQMEIVDETAGRTAEQPLWGEFLVSRPRFAMAEGKTFYCEPLCGQGRVYVFGCGHVAQELVPLLSHVGFRCVVCDDRPEFACRENFPHAEEVLVADLERIGESVVVTEEDYVCIMTRGHAYDYALQRQLLPCRPFYMGIMGSRNKIRVVTEKLLADGFSLEEIQSCHMPIGTAISAETPAEIAVSIAGELIQCRARREGREKR